jgi:hypothetical protein
MEIPADKLLNRLKNVINKDNFSFEDLRVTVCLLKNKIKQNHNKIFEEYENFQKYKNDALLEESISKEYKRKESTIIYLNVGKFFIKKKRRNRFYNIY